MVAFYDFPKQHWKHLRTTNVVESPFAAVRPRSEAARRFKKIENATAMIFSGCCASPSRGSERSTRRILPPRSTAA